ncbi:MAG TPA: cyclic lactone autoinducer peptide [Ruminococcaceae bacterium]|nr:cyclic lactone autoinducer peptide [Oscillospiraceae bacterium]
MKGLLIRIGAFVSSAALLVGISSMNTACWFLLHQPKVPAGMEKFKKA